MTHESDGFDTVLDEINAEGLMLPGSLKDCFESHREDLIRAACAGHPNNRLGWLLHEVNVFRDTPSQTSFNDAFDPFLKFPSEAIDLPIGTRITLPALPSTFVEQSGAHGSLVQLAMKEVFRLAGRLDAYDQEEIICLGTLARAGFVDPGTFADRNAIFRYVALNASMRIQEHLAAHPEIVPQRTLEFPDIMADRKRRLAAVIAKYPRIFVGNDEDLECCTDAHLRPITLDLDTLLLSPKTRHFGICRLCKRRLMNWQAAQAKFQDLAAEAANTAQPN